MKTDATKEWCLRMAELETQSHSNFGAGPMTDKTPGQELRDIAGLLGKEVARGTLQKWVVTDLLSLADRIERDHRAIVLPDPMPTEGNGMAAGWNACIDEFKRLNAVDAARGK